MRGQSAQPTPPAAPPPQASAPAAPRGVGNGKPMAAPTPAPLAGRTAVATPMQPTPSPGGNAPAAPPQPPLAQPAPPQNMDPREGPVPLQGDIDGDGQVTSSDGKALLSYLFNGASMPGGLENADFNGDGSVDIADAMQMFQAQAQAPESPPESPGSGTPVASPQPALPLDFQQARATSSYAKTLGLLAAAQKP